MQERRDIIEEGCCSKCGWDCIETDGDWYYIENGKFICCSDDEKTKKEKKVYPRVENYTSNEGDCTWTEIHCCPTCKEEIYLDTGN